MLEFSVTERQWSHSHSLYVYFIIYYPNYLLCSLSIAHMQSCLLIDRWSRYQIHEHVLRNLRQIPYWCKQPKQLATALTDACVQFHDPWTRSLQVYLQNSNALCYSLHKAATPQTRWTVAWRETELRAPITLFITQTQISELWRRYQWPLSGYTPFTARINQCDTTIIIIQNVSANDTKKQIWDL
jgi:hypothetical protein